MVANSALSSMNASPMGARGTFFVQLMNGGCWPLLIASAIRRTTSQLEVAHAGSITTVLPVAALIAACTAGLARAAAGTNAGLAVAFNTPMSSPLNPGAPAMSWSIMALKRVWKSATVVRPGVTPADGPNIPLTAGSRTSLLPIQTVTNVGCASRARWTCVLPPRMSCGSGVATVVGDSAVGSATAAKGTATLLRTSVTDAGLRRAQMLGFGTPPTKAPVTKFATGTGQPGRLIDG